MNNLKMHNNLYIKIIINMAMPILYYIVYLFFYHINIPYTYIHILHSH